MRRELVPDEALITGPGLEPVDLDFAKQHTRFQSISEDTLFDLYISAARGFFEEQTGRQVLEATWELWLECFPDGAIELPHPPLLSVESLIYVDSDGVEQTLVEGDDYLVSAPSGPYAKRGYIERLVDTDWPATAIQPKAVRVRYRAGYGRVTGDVPELIKLIILELAGNSHKYRTDTVETKFQAAFTQLPIGVRSFMEGFKQQARPRRTMVTSWV